MKLLTYFVYLAFFLKRNAALWYYFKIRTSLFWKPQTPLEFHCQSTCLTCFSAEHCSAVVFKHFLGFPQCYSKTLNHSWSAYLGGYAWLFFFFKFLLPNFSNFRLLFLSKDLILNFTSTIIFFLIFYSLSLYFVGLYWAFLHYLPFFVLIFSIQYFPLNTKLVNFCQFTGRLELEVDILVSETTFNLVWS